MNGTHRRDGIFIASQMGSLAESHPPTRLGEVAAWMAESLGLSWRPTTTPGSGPRRDYTEEEDAIVAARLRALGYLE